MQLTKEELEQEANREILNDIKKVLNKHAIKYMRTSAFMVVNECADKLVNIDQYTMLREYKNKVG